MFKFLFKTLEEDVWNKVSYNGVDDDISSLNSRNIVLSNRFGFTWSLMIIPYIVIFFFHEVFVAWLLLSIFFCHVLAIILNGFKWQLCSRIIQSTYPQTVIFFIGALVFNKPGQDRMACFHMLNLSFMVIPFMIFSFSELRYILLSLGVSIFEFLFFYKFNEIVQLPSSSSLYTTWWFEVLVYTLSVLLLMLGFTYLRFLNEYSHRRIKELLNESELKNTELKTRNDEVKTQRDSIIEQKKDIEIHHEALIKQTDIIIKQNKAISESLDYASIIQTTVMPSVDYFKRVLPSSFVLFKPRDRVSGDFYWIKQRGDKIFLACADCTGHGIPGGFLSMLGITLLDEICSKSREDINPADMLGQLRKEFLSIFHYRNKEYVLREGINMSLCIYDSSVKLLRFAGAIHSLFVVKDGGVMQFRGDKLPIGYFGRKEVKFSVYDVQVNESDVFYLTTDGYVDQFRHYKNSYKKFSTPRFRKYIEEIYDLPFEQQLARIEQKHDSWKESCDQTDDILVIGFRF